MKVCLLKEYRFFFQGHLPYLCINRFCWYLCFTAEEKPESKGKKVMGVGLGNIFEGGPIKLRSTAATTKRPVEKVSYVCTDLMCLETREYC